MYLRIGGRDVELVVHDPAATDADLAAAAGLPEPAGSPRPLTELGLRSGDDLAGVWPTPTPHANLPPDRAAVGGDPVAGSRVGLDLAVVGGIDSGHRVPLRRGAPITVGRGEDVDLVLDDPTVSRRHAAVALDPAGRVRWRDDGSRNGSWLLLDDGGEQAINDVAIEPGAEVRAGATRLALVAPVDDAPSAGRRPSGLAGSVPHNRPPRSASPPRPEPVEAPAPPAAPGTPVPLGVVAVAGPVAMAAVMVVVLGNPAFALFALLSPLLAVGNHLENRRRLRTGGRRDAVRWRDELARFRDALTDAAETELARRRAVAPDPAEIVRRATEPSARLWERRPSHDDWLHLRVGTGAAPWTPVVVATHDVARHPDIAAALAASTALANAPIAVDLGGGGVIGVAGDRGPALAVARSLLCQVAVLHGPADLPVVVACDEADIADWDWTKWLPHVDDADAGARRLAAGRDAVDRLADAFLRPGSDRAGAGSAVTTFFVVDGPELLAGRRAPLRRALEGRSGPVAGIVVAPVVDQLPAACTAVVVLDDEWGSAELRLGAAPASTGPARLVADGLADRTARRCARALAGVDDPELDRSGAGLPGVVRLLTLLELDPPDGALLADRWRAAGSAGRTVVPIGIDGAGVVEVDLDADGPHVLVAGTTGAGKSELLRSLVAGLAAGSPPERLTFVLVDFKGGSAFDACARLPHTVGIVTDLDAALAERALRCLEAELRHREGLLRSAGATDLRAYWRAVEGDPAAAPLPRLVVVVDEFATLRAELPEFVDSLVGVAQRGRSLGVHLVLATQRPAGAVSDHIKANTNLRIALRVQDRAESIDVIDGPDAASLSRVRPGRACLRFGPGDVTTIQTGLVTARPGAAPDPLELRPFAFGSPAPPHPSGATEGSDATGGGATDLDRLVDACVDAWSGEGRRAPRRPWPEPLPARLDTAALATAVASEPRRGLVAVGLADDPDHQRQLVAGWRPAAGNLVLNGTGGSGTTSTLLALALALAVAPPDEVQIVGVDHGAGGLRVLERLPHVVVVMGATELERQARFVRHLRGELDRRRSATASASQCSIVVLLDGAGAFLAAFDDVAGMEVTDAFTRVVTDGPAVGIHVVLTTDRVGALPAALTATIRQRWHHRLVDATEVSAAGLPGVSAAVGTTLPPGRFLDATSGLAVQVATPAGGWEPAFAAVASRWPGAAPAVAPAAVGTLPDTVVLAALGVPGHVGGGWPWTVPIGVADDDLGPAALVLHEGDHVLIAGPGRSGRTTALATIAASVRAACPDGRLVAVAGRRSWLGAASGVTLAGSVAEAVAAVTGGGCDVPTFLLVDDADGVADPDGAIEALLHDDATDVHVVAAGRAEVLRTAYGHWTRTVRRSRVGLLLRPHPDLDGELLGATLPRRPGAPMRPGRGYLVVDGVPSLVQVARVAGSGP